MEHNFAMELVTYNYALILSPFVWYKDTFMFKFQNHKLHSKYREIEQSIEMVMNIKTKNELHRPYRNIVMARKIYNRDTRLSHSDDVPIPPHKTDILKRSLIFNGGVIWNKLPDEIRMANDVLDFKWRYRQSLDCANTFLNPYLKMKLPSRRRECLTSVYRKLRLSPTTSHSCECVSHGHERMTPIWAGMGRY